jgi:hypothetical protein
MNWAEICKQFRNKHMHNYQAILAVESGLLYVEYTDYKQFKGRLLRKDNGKIEQVTHQEIFTGVIQPKIGMYGKDWWRGRNEA